MIVFIIALAVAIAIVLKALGRFKIDCAIALSISKKHFVRSAKRNCSKTYCDELPLIAFFDTFIISYFSLKSKSNILEIYILVNKKE